MKIAVLSELFAPYLAGGGERRYYEVSKRLAKRHEIHVYTLHIEGTPREEVLEGMHVHRLGWTHPLDRREYLPLASYFKELVPQLLRQKFDVIDGNAYISALGGFIGAKLRGTPSIATIHDLYGENWSDYVGGLGSLGRAIEYTLAKLPFDRILTVSHGTKGLLNRVYGAPLERVKVIPSGVDYGLFSSVDAERDMTKFIYVGRLVELKQLPDLLTAFGKVKEEIPDATLELVGQGPLRQSLWQEAKKLGIVDAVTFTGFVDSHEALAKKIAGSCALVNPSMREGLGLILIESMACGTPFIAYDLKAYEEFARPDNCLLAPQRDVDALASHMTAISTDKRKWKKMSMAGRKTAKEFSWESVCRKIEAVYEELVHP